MADQSKRSTLPLTHTQYLFRIHHHDHFLYPIVTILLSVPTRVDTVVQDHPIVVRLGNTMLSRHHNSETFPFDSTRCESIPNGQPTQRRSWRHRLMPTTRRVPGSVSARPVSCRSRIWIADRRTLRGDTLVRLHQLRLCWYQTTE